MAHSELVHFTIPFWHGTLNRPTLAFLLHVMESKIETSVLLVRIANLLFPNDIPHR